MVTASFDKREHLGAPSSELDVSCDSSSPVKFCNSGSMHTLEHISVSIPKSTD